MVTRILLVEDNADAREALRALLELDGYEVHAAADGTEGLDLARTKTPQVALVVAASGATITFLYFSVTFTEASVTGEEYGPMTPSTLSSVMSFS